MGSVVRQPFVFLQQSVKVGCSFGVLTGLLGGEAVGRVGTGKDQLLTSNPSTPMCATILLGLLLRSAPYRNLVGAGVFLPSLRLLFFYTTTTLDKATFGIPVLSSSIFSQIFDIYNICENIWS